MDGNFAELVDGAAQHLGLNDYQLSAAIGLLSNRRVYSPKQVGRLRRGEVVHPDPELVERLVTVLHLDPSEAFAAAMRPVVGDSGHALRHTAAQQLRRLTRDPFIVRDALRHSSLEMQSSYVGADLELLAGALAKLPDPLKTGS